MNLQLYNKTALVTGSTAGIDFAIAHVLSREGAVVIVNERSPERVNRAVRVLTEPGRSNGVLPVNETSAALHPPWRRG